MNSQSPMFNNNNFGLLLYTDSWENFFSYCTPDSDSSINKSFYDLWFYSSHIPNWRRHGYTSFSNFTIMHLVLSPTLMSAFHPFPPLVLKRKRCRFITIFTISVWQWLFYNKLTYLRIHMDCTPEGSRREACSRCRCGPARGPCTDRALRRAPTRILVTFACIIMKTNAHTKVSNNVKNHTKASKIFK